MMEVIIGAVLDPVTYWIAPVEPPKWLQETEKLLVMCLRASKPSHPDILREICSSGEIVAIRNQNGEWHRGKLAGEIAEYLEGPRGKFFLIDSGTFTDIIDLKMMVRPMPKNVSVKNAQAVKFCLKGLLPVSRQLNMEMFLEAERFRPTVAPYWPESSQQMMHALINQAEKAFLSEVRPVEVGSSEATGILKLLIGQNKKYQVLDRYELVPGRLVDVKKFLVATEHATVAEKATKARAMHPYYSLMNPAKPREDPVDPWETVCRDRKKR